MHYMFGQTTYALSLSLSLVSEGRVQDDPQQEGLQGPRPLQQRLSLLLGSGITGGKTIVDSSQNYKSSSPTWPGLE